jgi:hypothetical protein
VLGTKTVELGEIAMLGAMLVVADPDDPNRPSTLKENKYDMPPPEPPRMEELRKAGKLLGDIILYNGDGDFKLDKWLVYKEHPEELVQESEEGGDDESDESEADESDSDDGPVQGGQGSDDDDEDGDDESDESEADESESDDGPVQGGQDSEEEDEDEDEDEDESEDPDEGDGTPLLPAPWGLRPFCHLLCGCLRPDCALRALRALRAQMTRHLAKRQKRHEAKALDIGARGWRAHKPLCVFLVYHIFSSRPWDSYKEYRGVGESCPVHTEEWGGR